MITRAELKEYREELAKITADPRAIIGRTGAVVAELNILGYTLHAGALKGEKTIILCRFQEESILIYRTEEELYNSTRSDYFIPSRQFELTLDRKSEVDSLAEDIIGEDESDLINEGELVDILDNCNGTPEKGESCDDCCVSHRCKKRYEN